MRTVVLVTLYVAALNQYVLPRYVIAAEGYHASSVYYLAYALLQPGNVRAYRCNAVTADTAQTTVNTAVAAASDGAHVCITHGASTWTTITALGGTVSSRTKMVSLHGAGTGTNASTNTKITANNTTNNPNGSTLACCPVIVVYNTHTLGHNQISGIRFEQGPGWDNSHGEEFVWAISEGGHCDIDTCLWRVDHNHFEQNTASDGCCNGNILNAMRVGGYGIKDSTLEATRILNYGVIDHNTAHGPGSFQFVDVVPCAGNNEGNICGNLAWQTDVSEHQNGSFKCVFVEANVFTGDHWSNNNAVLDGQAGACITFRYNLLTNNWAGGHGEEGDRSIKYFEKYYNTYILDDLGSGYANPSSTRGGTGVIHHERYCDGSSKCGYTFSGTRTWSLSPAMELQYYRALADGDFRGPKDASLGIDGQGSNASIPECANTALTVGIDNQDHVSPASDAGWICGGQPGAKKGNASSGIWGYSFATEPIVAWANYYGSGTSTAAVMAAFNPSTAVYVLPRRDFISEDGTAADCTSHMAEAICLAWWDPTTHQKVGYVQYPYPNPLTVP